MNEQVLHYQQPPESLQPTPEKKKTKKWPWILATVAVLGIIGAATGGGEEAPEPADQASDQVAEKDVKEATEVEPKAKPDMTVSQENAIESAESYLDFSGFSRAGLIGQLSSEYGEGFSKADAIYAVNHVDVDWNKEAAEAAQSYLDTGSFSRDGLIEQLESQYGEKFTHAQAVYGVNQTGL